MCWLNEILIFFNLFHDDIVWVFSSVPPTHPRPLYCIITTYVLEISPLYTRLRWRLWKTGTIDLVHNIREPRSEKNIFITLLICSITYSVSIISKWFVLCKSFTIYNSTTIITTTPTENLKFMNLYIEDNRDFLYNGL